jgi:hypothetical protein
MNAEHFKKRLPTASVNRHSDFVSKIASRPASRTQSCVSGLEGDLRSLDEREE